MGYNMCRQITTCMKIQTFQRNLQLMRRFHCSYSQRHHSKCCNNIQNSSQYFVKSHIHVYNSLIYRNVCHNGKIIPLICREAQRNFSTCHKLYLNNSESSDGSEKCLFHLRYVFVKACENQWEDIPGGVTFDLAYVDTHPGESYDPTKPVIVGVHGAPGSHKHFLSIFEPFAAKGYRVIIPNFPGYSYTKGVGPGHDDCFSHAPEEKAELLANLLTELGIPIVELMVSHSAGSYPVIHLCAQTNSIRSAMLICPSGHLIYRGIKPFFLLKAISEWWDMPMLRPYIKLFVKLAAIPTVWRALPASHLVESVRSVTNVDFEHAGSCFVAMEMKKMPYCIVFTDNDPRIALPIYQEINKLLGITDERIVTYEQDGSCKTQQGVKDSPKGVLLRNGGHFPMKKYTNVIIGELQELLKQIWKGQL